MDTVRYEDLGRAALYGDTAAVQVIRDLAGEFSFALSNLICLVHPRLIVLGGNSVSLGSVFLEEIRRSLSETGFEMCIRDRIQTAPALPPSMYIRGPRRRAYMWPVL